MKKLLHQLKSLQFMAPDALYTELSFLPSCLANLPVPKPAMFLQGRSALRLLPPLTLRLLVVLLAFVQFVAPTWHVCSLGGHSMAMQGGSQHHGQKVVAAPTDGPVRPLICYCAPKDDHKEEPEGPKLTATPSHGDHATCLALLLQTMPGAIAPAIVLPGVGEPVQFTWTAAYLSSPAYSPLPRFRGRAPPLSC